MEKIIEEKNIDEKNIDEKNIDEKVIDEKIIDEKKNNITVIESIKTNYLSWIFIILSVLIVSYPSNGKGFLTLFGLLFLSYFSHLFSHMDKNIFTILHQYHHDNDNFFSHFSQIILELSLSSIIFLSNYFTEYYLGTTYIDIWTGLLYILFYSSVHNYNYGQLRVNDVHYLHHKNIFTNIGPDICDIAFGTKHPSNTEVENTNHYIPNVIVITIFILSMKYLCIDENIKNYLSTILSIVIVLMTLFVSISSIYLYMYHN